MKENILRGLISAMLAAFAVYMQALIVPLAVLIIFLVVDWLTGLAAAGIANEISSRVGIIGIIKKVCYLVVVVVGMGVDYIIGIAGAQLGYDLSKVFTVALVVIVWLILNEFISILENLDEIGVPLPSFLCKIVEKLKKQTDIEVE